MKNITIFCGSKKVRAKLLFSPLSQVMGLMFQKPYPVLMDFKSERKSLGVHMFFCFWPLDLIFISKKKQVVELVLGIKPFRWHTAKSAYYLLELPAGQAKLLGLKLGSKLQF